ncbi:MAG: S41 family peptidase [Bacilli bacterium]
MKDKLKDSFKNLKYKLKKSFKFVSKKNQYNFMEVVAIMIITTIFGMLLGGILMYRKGSLNMGIKKELNEFLDTYTEILNEYYEEIPENELLEAGVKGMIGYLGDPYSVYMDKDTSIAFNEKINGEYVGIGTEIIQYSDGKIEFNDVYEDGPAYEAGIRVKDILIKVDDTDISDKTLSEVSSLVKGKSGSKVKITVLRDDEEKTFEVKRKSIDITSVTSDIIEYKDSKVGVLTISLFAANTDLQFEKELKELENKKIDSLIIDVRGNSGGYLNVVSDILSHFIKKGEMLYQLKTKDKIEKIYDKTEDKRNYKVAILVNGGSASASELLASCMKDTYKAYTVGTVTYGKSKVQKTQDLSNGATIKFTFQEWLMPSGESVGGKGMEPEYVVPYEASDTEHEYDSQMQKALDLLTEE